MMKNPLVESCHLHQDGYASSQVFHLKRLNWYLCCSNAPKMFLYLCRILQKCTTFGRSDMHIVEFLKSSSNIDWYKWTLFHVPYWKNTTALGNYMFFPSLLLEELFQHKTSSNSCMKCWDTNTPCVEGRMPHSTRDYLRGTLAHLWLLQRVYEQVSQLPIQ